MQSTMGVRELRLQEREAVSQSYSIHGQDEENNEHVCSAHFPLFKKKIKFLSRY